VRLSPERKVVVGDRRGSAAAADAVGNRRKARPARRNWPGATGPPGSKNRARGQGFPRNLGDPVVSTETKEGKGNSLEKPRPERAAFRAHGIEEVNAVVVGLSEGNEARPEGRLGVRAPRLTVEAGEPTQGTLQRGGGAGIWNRRRARCRRH